MKILFYNDSSVFGGHEASAIDAIQGLLDEKHEVFIVYSTFNKIFEEKLQNRFEASPNFTRISYPYKIHKFKRYFEFFNIINIYRLIKLLKKNKIDLLITIQGIIEISYTALISARIVGLTSICYIPMNQSFKLTSKFPIWIIRDLINILIYHLPNRIITTSNSSKNDILKKFSLSKKSIDVVYCGANIESLRLLPKAKNSKIHLGIFGRIELEQKNHIYLIKLLEKFCEKLPEFKLIILGDGKDKIKVLDYISSSKIKEFIEYVPWTNDMSKMYQKIDILVLPSIVEGYPIVQIEAMYYKIPVLASNRDGMKEDLPKEWLFDLENYNSFFKAFQAVYNDKNLEEKLERLHDLTLEKYNSKNFGNKFLNLVQECFIENKKRQNS